MVWLHLTRPDRSILRKFPQFWLGLVLLAFLLAVSASPAGAHTDLLQASPGVGQSAGGDVHHIDMVFTEPVSDVKVVVTDPSGMTVPGRMVVDQGAVVSFDLDRSIAESGRYTVSYTMTSFDLDFTARDYFFDYEESAPQPFRIGFDGRYIVEPPGTNWLSLFSTLLLAVSVVGVASMLIYRQGFFRSLAGPTAGAEPHNKSVEVAGDSDSGDSDSSDSDSSDSESSDSESSDSDSQEGGRSSGGESAAN